MKPKHIIFILIIIMLIAIEIKVNQDTAPESVIIRVLKQDGSPETQADCKADIITQETTKKQLKKIDDMFKYIDIKKFDMEENRGYYLLETGLTDYKGNFEIKIVCISPQFKGVSYTIINNTHSPCELRDNGKFVVC